MLLGDVAFEEFLHRSDTGLSADELASGWKLHAAMEEFAAATPDHLSAEVIDHPLWRVVQAAASQFLEALHDQRAPKLEANTPTP